MLAYIKIIFTFVLLVVVELTESILTFEMSLKGHFPKKEKRSPPVSWPQPANGHLFYPPFSLTTNIDLIQALTQENLLPEYAVWRQIKGLYVSSRIHDYTILGLHKKSGITRNRIRKYINFFLENGWAYMDNGSLVLISLKKLKKKFGIEPLRTKRGHYLKSNIKLSISRNHKEDVLNLQLEIMRDKQRKFNFVKQKKDDLIEPRGLGALQRHQAAKKYFKGVPAERLASTLSAVPEYYTTSTASIARIWNVSSSTASRRIKKLEKMKKVRVKRYGLTVVKFPPGKKPKEIPQRCFFHKNCLFKQEPNSYVFY